MKAAAPTDVGPADAVVAHLDDDRLDSRTDGHLDRRSRGELGGIGEASHTGSRSPPPSRREPGTWDGASTTDTGLCSTRPSIAGVRPRSRSSSGWSPRPRSRSSSMVLATCTRAEQAAHRSRASNRPWFRRGERTEQLVQLVHRAIGQALRKSYPLGIGGADEPPTRCPELRP